MKIIRKKILSTFPVLLLKKEKLEKISKFELKRNNSGSKILETTMSYGINHYKPIIKIEL